MADRPELTHESVEERMREVQEWPQYYRAGGPETIPAFYRVEGPNGPVSYLHQDSEAPTPTTMHGFAMEARTGDFELVLRYETPWPRFE